MEVMPEVGDSTPGAAEGGRGEPRALRDGRADDGPGLEHVDDDLTVETVQLIKVQFRIEKAVEFVRVLRMVGGHGAWERSLRVPTR